MKKIENGDPSNFCHCDCLFETWIESSMRTNEAHYYNKRYLTTAAREHISIKTIFSSLREPRWDWLLAFMISLNGPLISKELSVFYSYFHLFLIYFRPTIQANLYVLENNHTGRLENKWSKLWHAFPIICFSDTQNILYKIRPISYLLCAFTRLPFLSNK